MSCSKKIEAVFIDRDGTIGGSNVVIYPGSFELFPFTKQSLEILKDAGVHIYSFTNQPGISRGEASMNDFHDELSTLALIRHTYSHINTWRIVPAENLHQLCLIRQPKTTVWS